MRRHRGRRAGKGLIATAAVGLLLAATPTLVARTGEPQPEEAATWRGERAGELQHASHWLRARGGVGCAFSPC